jgi:hypothetical protein
MGRGLARHRQVGGGPKYDLKGVRAESRVCALIDMKYRRRELGTRMGTIIRRAAGRVSVVWDEDPDEVVIYAEGDVRYWVDTDRWRITPPPTKSIFSNNMRTSP